MRFLLDTHTFLWFVNGDERLSFQARHLILSNPEESFLSTASLWEIAIKISTGKLRFSQPFEIFVPFHLEENGFQRLEIQFTHLAVITTLPFHHRDPFDRLLIAQSLVEHMPVISADTTFDAYPITRLW